MKLRFKTEYLSIKEFEEIELNNFSIVTGLNGSGKTHLLKALKDGHCQIDSIVLKDIVFFDFIQFRADNENASNKEQISQERQSAWNLFIDESNRNLPQIQKNLLQIKKNQLSDTDYEKIEGITRQKNKLLFNLDDADFESNLELKNKFINYTDSIQDFFSQEKLKTNPQIQGIYALSKKLDFFIDAISQHEFMNLYVPISLKENFLPTQLGKIFMDYRVKEFEEYHKNLGNLNNSTDRNQLKIQAQEKCKKLYGGSTPWEIINEFLSTYHSFPYNISYPEEFTEPTYFYRTDIAFTPTLNTAEKDLSINYQDLSSGEQILFSLALCLFKGKSDNAFPKLLLLDEIDATLHPSMINNLLQVIHEVLLKRGTKVVLASHSPTTIALASEEEVFVVNKEGKNKIEKFSKKETLSILTEGYMTMDEGIKLFDQIGKQELSIITEGNNIKYIEKAADFFASDIKDKIDIIKGAEAISGSKQLKTLFDFLAKIHHDKKVVFVWDHDYDVQSLEDENNTYAFSFEKNTSNKIAQKGIENLFNEKFFSNFTKSEIDSHGNELKKWFAGNKKNEFMKYILSNPSSDTFKNFKPLFNYINEKILNTK